jgi:hypothetical protein
LARSAAGTQAFEVLVSPSRDGASGNGQWGRKARKRKDASDRYHQSRCDIAKYGGVEAYRKSDGCDEQPD